MIKKLCLLLAVFCVAVSLQLLAQANTTINIIPKPVSVKMKTGSFEINSNTCIYVESVDSDAAWSAVFFKDLLEQAGLKGIKVQEAPKDIKSVKNAIFLQFTKKGNIPDRKSVV